MSHNLHHPFYCNAYHTVLCGLLYDLCRLILLKLASCMNFRVATCQIFFLTRFSYRGSLQLIKMENEIFRFVIRNKNLMCLIILNFSFK